jgi:hypothetical protein
MNEPKDPANEDCRLMTCSLVSDALAWAESNGGFVDRKIESRLIDAGRWASAGENACEILAAEYKTLAEWITDAAPVLESACCLALEADTDNVSKMPGCQALMETCPVPFVRMTHLISHNSEGLASTTGSDNPNI